MNCKKMIDNNMREDLREKLNIGQIDRSILQDTAGYFFAVSKMLDNIRQGYCLWLDQSSQKEVDTKDFLSGMLSMFALLKKAMDRMDGIVGLYISRLNVTVSEKFPWLSTVNVKPVSWLRLTVQTVGVS